MSDNDLRRFVQAQDEVTAQVRAELSAGRKRTHWMWFVFPQVAGLGSSATSRHFAIASLEEARAYLAHPVLGHRLRECTEWALASGVRDANALFGDPDDLKFHASMTLFAAASDDDEPFIRALSTFFAGVRHRATLQRLGLG